MNVTVIKTSIQQVLSIQADIIYTNFEGIADKIYCLSLKEPTSQLLVDFRLFCDI